MYAIIETGGKQFWVEPGEKLRIEKLEAEKGAELKFKALWAVGEAKEGSEPAVSRQGEVTVEVLSQKRAPKIIVFQKKTKKAYKRIQGHRQYFTEILIKSISLN